MKINNLFFALLIALLITACNPKQAKDAMPQQSTLPSLIEIIASDSIIDGSKLTGICKEQGIPTSSLYQWKNHLVIFDTISNPDNLLEIIAANYPETFIRLYKKPFYEFNRSLCENKATVKEWSHTIMTAYLVDDTAMQKEYMDYHATQFEKWPEISKGFCNADFQQLLIFRNNRQLMLIISIPKGENLDELNPKTTENNPRVDEWNVIMGKYQEGIEGTEPGDTWVVLSPVTNDEK